MLTSLLSLKSSWSVLADSPLSATYFLSTTHSQAASCLLSLDGVFCGAEVFSFHGVELTGSFFLGTSLWCLT